MKNITLIIAIILISMQSCISDHNNKDSIALKRVDSLFNSLYPANEPGVAVLILKQDSIIFDKGYGMADMEKQTPIDGNTFFNIASVSKQFSGVALMMLAEEGKLSLDDNVKKWFPDFKADFFEKITSVFHFHRLEMEDVFNVYQRPKLDEYEGHLFFTSRMLSMNNGELSNDQLSLMLGSNFVITIQEKRQDFFEPVRLRLRNSKGTIRSLKSDYIAYALMDAIVDFYYPALEEIGIKLDDLEEELLSKPTSESLNKILQIKRELIVFKRAIWPERDKINDVIRSSFDEIHEDTKVYFRDSYDHCIQILDIVESYKEVTSSLMDVYLSSVSNKLNQVMKVLTIISTIFIPLTFIVGLYGMNFQGTNPTTGDKLPLNMPELYSPYGYVGVIVVMILIVAIQLYIFHRKGWIRFREN